MDRLAIVIAWALGSHVVLSLFVWMVVGAATQSSAFRADRTRPDEAFPLRLSALHLCANLGALSLGLVPTGDRISGGWDSALLVTLLLLGGWSVAMAAHGAPSAGPTSGICPMRLCRLHLAVMSFGMFTLLQVSLV